MKIGIMQGRLSPMQGDRMQFSPVYWAEEFDLAQRLGFSSIEWLVDWDHWHSNPIFSPLAHREIKKKLLQTNIRMNVLGCDVVMKCPLFGAKRGEGIRALTLTVKALKMLVALCEIKDPVFCIPLLEGNAPKKETEIKETLQSLNLLFSAFQDSNIRFALEVEMAAQQVLHFIELLQHPYVGVCYDLGNATSYGFNCSAEIRLLNKKIFNVHIKDRRRLSADSQRLGRGDVDFGASFVALEDIKYEGPITMQAFRTSQNYLTDAQSQLDYIKNIVQSMKAEK